MLCRCFSQQQRVYYEGARDAYLKAAANTKCPERAAVLREYAAWNQCMADVLAGTKSSCSEQPTTPIPPCDGDMTGNNSNTSASPTYNTTNSTTNYDAANSVEELVNGIGELARMKLDKNEDASDWFLLSVGANLGGDSGPIAGTTPDIGQLSGFNFYAQTLSRKGLSFISSYTSLKANYFHSFRGKTVNGDYYQYVGRTDIDMPILDFSLGKDYVGKPGKFHFVPNIGADFIFGIDNHFTTKSGIEYQETWNDKTFFFALHAGIQMYYLFSTRFGLQGGGKYLFFPTETKGAQFSTSSFLYLNAGITVRIV